MKKPNHKIDDIIIIKESNKQHKILDAYIDKDWYYRISDETWITDDDIVASLTIKKWYNKEKKEKKLWEETSIEYRISKLLLDCIKRINPTYKQPNLNNWADEVDKIIRLDNRPTEEIVAVIQAVFKDDFWSTVIQSTSKLRKQYDKLKTKFIVDNKTNNPIIC